MKKILSILLLWILTIIHYRGKIRKLRDENLKYNISRNNNVRVSIPIKEEKTLEEKIKNMQISANYYTAKEKFWDSEFEGKVYSIINRFIDNNKRSSEFDLNVIPHVSLREIFMYKNDKDFKKAQENLRILSTYHIDMLLVDKTHYSPLIAIEIDGKNHQTDEKTIIRDAFKNQLFLNNDIHLLRISNENCNYQYIKEVLEEQLEKLPPICKKCGANLVHKVNSGTGKTFWGCPNYTKLGCDFSKSLD